MTAILKTFLLLSCTFLGLICGTLYLYSSYSPQLAAKLHYTASNSLKIGLSGLIGVALSGPFVGKLVDSLGYTIPLVVGGVINVFLYGILKWQFDTGFSSVGLSSILLFSIGCGSTFMNSACLKLCAVHFPTIRGVATALPLALYGLSALFYSFIASIFYPDNTSGFLEFITYSLAILFLVFSPKIVLFEKSQKNSQVAIQSSIIELEDLNHKTIDNNIIPTRSTGSVNNSRNQHIPQPQVGGAKLIKSRKFWILFLVLGILAAVGQMYIYSVGYITKALVIFHIDPDLANRKEISIEIQQFQQFQVGLISITNCLGRIFAGIAGDLVSNMTSFHHKPRSLLLFVPTFGLLLAQVLGEKCSRYEDLSIVSSLFGFFYGFAFCIFPLVVGDTFGLDNFSLNWGIINLAPIMLSYYFTSLFGETFDRNSRITELGDEICTLGSSCYKSVFVFTSYGTVFAIFLVIVFNWKRH